MHRLLQRQLRRHLSPDQALEVHWQPLLAAIDAYYQEVDQERMLLENAMAVSSDELTGAIARARREETILRGVMDSIPDLMCFKNTEGRYLGCNKAFERYFFTTEAEMTGKTDFDLLPPDIAREVQESDQAVLHSRSKRLSERWFNLPRGGRRICLEVLTSPYSDLSGQLLGLISIARDITTRKEAEETIYRQAHYDTLTALPNRRFFYDRLAQEIQHAHSTQLPAALMVIDLDRFKQVNDLLGHAAGDTLLVEAAQRITQCVRETDTVARLGGDEFIVVVPGLREAQQAEQIAQKIIERMALPFTLGKNTASVSASIGIALYPVNAHDIDSLIRHADQAMYVAKSNGRSRFSAFTEVLHEATLKRRRLTAEIAQAVDAGELLVHYQPVHNLRTGRIDMAEALVRWQHPQDGLIPAAELLSIGEDSGCLADIGRFVLDQATQWLRHLRTTIAPDFQITLNMLAAQFRRECDAVPLLLGRLTALGLPAAALAIDLSEDLLMKLDAPLEAQLQALRAAGIGLTLDDFGTAHTALGVLQRLEVGTLKIDAERVSRIETDVQARMFCQAAIAMAHGLGMKACAEGVTTEAQRAWLVAASCDLAQGYLWGQPQPAARFEEWLRERKGVASSV